MLILMGVLPSAYLTSWHTHSRSHIPNFILSPTAAPGFFLQHDPRPSLLHLVYALLSRVLAGALGSNQTRGI